jgi:hypothetical protein
VTVMVEIRCAARHRKLLLQLTEEPAWDATIRVPPCPEHHGHVPVTSGRRAAKRIRDAARRQGARDKVALTVALEVDAEDLRPYFDQHRANPRKAAVALV